MTEIYVETRDRLMPNMALGIYKGVGKNRELLATVPLALWQSPRPIGGNAHQPENRNALRRAQAIASYLQSIDDLLNG